MSLGVNVIGCLCHLQVKENQSQIDLSGKGNVKQDYKLQVWLDPGLQMVSPSFGLSPSLGFTSFCAAVFSGSLSLILVALAALG